MFLTSLKQTCNEYLIKFSDNQSAPKLENRKTSPCSPCAPNLLHVLVSQDTYAALVARLSPNLQTALPRVLDELERKQKEGKSSEYNFQDDGHTSS